MSPPSFRHEDIARVVAACVLALATVLAVVLVVTDGDSTASPAAFGGDAPRAPGAPGEADVPGSSSGDGGGGASPGAVAPSTPEQLKSVFPFPRRSRPTTVDDRYLPPDGILEARIVRADLATVKSFYDRELAELGLEPEYFEITQGAKLVGYSVSYHTDDYELTGTFRLFDNISGDTPGQITIAADFR